MTKILDFFNTVGLVEKTNYKLFQENTKIIIKKIDDNFLKFIVTFIKPIDAWIYFDFLEKIKFLDESIKFEIKNDFDGIDNKILQSYLIYFLNNNALENKVFIESIIKRQELIFDNNTLIISYLNENELYLLTNTKNKLLSFLTSCEFPIDDIEFKLDTKTHEIKNFKKHHYENAINIINKKSQTTVENKMHNKEFKFLNISESKSTKIIDLIPEQQTAIIEGEIFKIDLITTKTNSIIYKIYVTDYSDSIIIKAFPKEKGLTTEILESLKVGQWIKAKINLQIDIYDDNSLSGIISSLMLIEKPASYIRSDDYYKKRVELIVHTNMTAFEGLINVEELFQLMNDLNHKTVAITDKGNCQSFPDALKYSQKYKMDLIYGFQTEIVNNPVPIVLNPNEQLINDITYVIFDLETTGLSPYYDKIIEFGAIKYSKGKKIDEIQFFIDPEISIPENIVSITKISNDDVKGQIKIEEALKKILDFFGDSVLIAHNGIKFDLPFINCKLAEFNLPKITNPLIDTMQVSRSINEQIQGHSLGAICRKYKILYDENEAHRADVDSEFLLQVWKRMQLEFERKEIFTLNQLNNNLQNNFLYQRNKGYLSTIYCLKQDYVRHFYKTISISLTENYYNGSKIFKNKLEEYRQYFLISNSPTEGEILDKAISNTDEELEKAISYYDFITIAPLSCFAHDINRKIYSENTLKKAIIKIIKIAKKLNKLVVASSDTYYLNRDDKSIFDVYVHTKSIGGKRHRFFKYDNTNDIMPDLHYRTTNEMLNEFAFLNDSNLINEIVIDNTVKIAEKFEKNIIPIKNELCSPSIEGAEEKLKSKIWENAQIIYGDNIHPDILERVNHEINSVINHGYSMIYWFSHLLVKKSIDDGYVVGSRGSVGSSVAAWLINISEVNPLPPHYLCKNCKYLKFMPNYASGFDLPNQNCPYCNSLMSGDGHNIPFETFMGFKGDKIPDIDLNFSAVYQSKAHEFIRDMFGKEKVLRAGTIGTVAEKTAFGYVKGYFDSINKANIKNAEIIRIAKKCENVKRTTGQHPGGIIVIPKEYEVYDFTPINFPADDTSLDWHTTHFAFESLHDSLLKFDILGHDNPTVLKMLTEQTGVDANSIPNYDKDVMELFASTKSLNLKYADIDEIIKVGTNGVPEFGTNFVKEMLLITRPQKFSSLIRISGLSHGTNVWNGNAKTIIEELGISISEVISCRDDIMVYLIQKGVESLTAFKIMEDVRKGKGLKEEYIAILEEKKIDKWYIESCMKISYLFPKAHATAYVIMAWKIAWFKIHYPLHFYSSFLTIRRECFDLETIIKGKTAILEKMNDIKSRLNNPKTKSLVKNKEKDLLPIYEICLEIIARGFNIKNIDLSKSLENEFVIENNVLIAPFTAIDGLGEQVAKTIVEARNAKPFVSKEDLLERTKITKTHFKILGELGVLSHLEEDNQLTIFG